jgi:hypothetical protein
MVTNRMVSMKYIAYGITEGYIDPGILNKFRLGTSTNISKQKKVFYEKELFDIRNSKLEFLDPAYELWFIKHILRTTLPYRGL